MAANGNKECKAKSHVMNRSWRKRQVKLDSNNIFEIGYGFDLRVKFCSYIGQGPSDPA